LGPLAVEDIDAGVMPRVDRTAPRPPQVQPVQAPVQQADTQAAVAEAQRLQDAMLLEQQQAASQRQQGELDQEIEQDVRAQQEMEAEKGEQVFGSESSEMPEPLSTRLTAVPGHWPLPHDLDLRILIVRQPLRGMA